MKLIILAAGEGQRMRPLTLTTPKPLAVYRGKPALDHLFLALPREIDEAIIITKYLGHKIKAHCSSRFYGRKITYVEGESNGNAIGFLKTKVHLKEGERFAVSYADDILTRQEIVDCLKHEHSWLCYNVHNPHEVGIASINENNHIIDVIEKPKNPPSNFTANGFMIMNTNIFSYKPELHPEKKEYYLTDIMKKYAQDHNVVAVIGDTHHMQLTSMGDIDILNKKV
jgi:dTDP-glucose pyrophosphorylase